MIKIIFVCLGNICRSPLAEAIFNHKVKEKGLDQALKGESCGTADYHIGEDPDTRSIAVAVKHKVEISHKGRQFHFKDGKNYNYILAMDMSNHRNIIHTLGYKHEGLFLMRDFDEQAKGADVPDPYYGGEDGFEDVYQMLDRTIESFIDYIVKEHDL
ncbi:MAG: low molecular weight protein-tyrosine-phosphatase [Marinoscillum sp.]